MLYATHRSYGLLRVINGNTAYHHSKKESSFLGIAFEIEKPVVSFFSGLWKLFTSPVDPVGER